MINRIAFQISVALLLGYQSLAVARMLPWNYTYATAPNLQGAWKVIGNHYNGQAHYPHTENTHWRISKDEITIVIDGQDRGAWRYRFTAGKHGWIDLNNYPCLFELRDRELKVCICQFPERGSRPTEFSTGPDSVHVMYHLRREQD